ncbi:14-3-3 16R [Olea europaea subsp. europaea]|uniref:14-3-3 16R n=2 Tax=Olea europaea subsp. europaea TaxID=158383 RepID=A0A8S0PMA5_OLEEU|nr:14-3-3 16R [Olea europaea subsp. europaea]
MASNCKENVYIAKQIERYEEMVEYMEKVVTAVEGKELTVEERNLLSVAYKNVIGARRASWRIMVVIISTQWMGNTLFSLPLQLLFFVYQVQDWGGEERSCREHSLDLQGSSGHCKYRACSNISNPTWVGTQQASLMQLSYKDSTLIMQLLRDNLTLWTSDMQDDGSEETKEAPKPDNA